MSDEKHIRDRRLSVQAFMEREGDPEGHPVVRMANEADAWGLALEKIGEINGKLSVMQNDFKEMKADMQILKDERQQRKGVLWLGGAMWVFVVFAISLLWPDVRAALKK